MGTSDACIFCNQGGVPMMCEHGTCSHVAHLECTDFSKDLDEWLLWCECAKACTISTACHSQKSSNLTENTEVGVIHLCAPACWFFFTEYPENASVHALHLITIPSTPLAQQGPPNLPSCAVWACFDGTGQKKWQESSLLC